MTKNLSEIKNIKLVYLENGLKNETFNFVALFSCLYLPNVFLKYGMSEVLNSSVNYVMRTASLTFHTIAFAWAKFKSLVV